jgi:release factor glutamine methyltransferase
MNVVKRIRKSLGKWIIIPFVKKYISQERSITIDDISLKIPIGVFHPTLYLSTKYLFQWLESQDIKEKEVLELGAGSGLLSIKMAKMGANVTASDIVLSEMQRETMYLFLLFILICLIAFQKKRLI